jgi:hypothetical protein
VPYLPSPEDETRCSVRNIVLISYVNFRTIDEDHSPIDSGRSATSSEAFGLDVGSEVPDTASVLTSRLGGTCGVRTQV